MSADPMTGFRVSEEGGLFAAITEKYRTAIIVPPSYSLTQVAVGGCFDSPGCTDRKQRSMRHYSRS